MLLISSIILIVDTHLLSWLMNLSEVSDDSWPEKPCTWEFAEAFHSSLRSLFACNHPAHSSRCGRDRHPSLMIRTFHNISSVAFDSSATCFTYDSTNFFNLLHCNALTFWFRTHRNFLSSLLQQQVLGCYIYRNTSLRPPEMYIVGAWLKEHISFLYKETPNFILIW